MTSTVREHSSVKCKIRQIGRDGGDFAVERVIMSQPVLRDGFCHKARARDRVDTEYAVLVGYQSRSLPSTSLEQLWGLGRLLYDYVAVAVEGDRTS